MFSYENNARINFWNKPVVSEEIKVYKQRGSLNRAELTTDGVLINTFINEGAY